MCFSRAGESLIVVGRTETFSHFCAAVFAASAELAGAKWRLSFRCGGKPPADHLRQRPGFVNFARVDATGQDHLPARWVVRLSKLRDGLRSGDLTMGLPVMADPNELFIGNAKVDSGNGPLVTPLQLSQPLVRGIKAASNRYGVNASRRFFGSFPQASDAIAANPWDSGLRRQMNKHRHSRLVRDSTRAFLFGQSYESSVMS